MRDKQLLLEVWRCTEVGWALESTDAFAHISSSFLFIALFSFTPQGKVTFFRSFQVGRLIWCQALLQPAAQWLAKMQLQPEVRVLCPMVRTLQVPPEGRSAWLLVSVRELPWQLGVNLFLSSYCTVFYRWVAALLFSARRWSPELSERTRAWQCRIYFPALDATQESAWWFLFSTGFSKFCNSLWEAFKSVLLGGSHMLQGPPFMPYKKPLDYVIEVV